MFGIGPTELAFFLVIVLLVVGPEKLPTFMRAVGRGVRQVKNASRDFKDAIGFDDLMREGDPFRAPPIRAPKARPVPAQDKAPSPPPGLEEVKASAGTRAASAAPPTPATDEPAPVADEPDPAAEADAPAEAKRP
jgi:sec-independent protein translocase protein TatA